MLIDSLHMGDYMKVVMNIYSWNYTCRWYFKNIFHSGYIFGIRDKNIDARGYSFFGSIKSTQKKTRSQSV